MNSTQLQFDKVTPVAPEDLGGLFRDRFGHGRLFATVAAHGGLTEISHWGRQNIRAPHFFEGDPGTGWTKLFRFCARIGGARHYLTLHDTELFPFGFRSRCELAGVSFRHELLLLPDAVVQRFEVLSNPGRLPIAADMLHQESVTAVERPHRKWADLAFHPKLNALVASCADDNPRPENNTACLAQQDFGLVIRDAPHAVTWIALGCDAPITTRRGYHPRSKHYIESAPVRPVESGQNKQAAYFLVFAHSRPALVKRLAELRKTVHAESAALIDGYEKRLRSRPRIDTGSPVLNSAFNQYPEVIQQMKLPDRPGAVRGTLAGYFVWGWDGMTPLATCPLANEPEYSAAILRFFQKTRHPRIGIPHAFNTDFRPRMKGPFPAQCQFIAGLYHYIAATGDLTLAKEVLPTCKFLLDRCRRDEIKGTGLVRGPALWPDFPEAMEENGHDISSLNNSLLYQALRAMEYIAAALGYPAWARQCRDWAARLRVNFVKYLFDEEHGYFISSCSSIDFKPRKHYCAQAIFWLIPFARELVSHAPGRIVAFLDKHLRSKRCLLTLPHWDTAWMADGNQLGSSYPAADTFYLNAHKLLGDPAGLAAWLGDVEWFWRRHTAPEAFTPEAENEEALGPDNTGGKQLQAVTTWYLGLFNSAAGLDLDHEGLTITPTGALPVTIRGLRLHHQFHDIHISGAGPHLASLRLNGKPLPLHLRKILWSAFATRNAVAKRNRLEIVRTETPPTHPVIVRADGLQVRLTKSSRAALEATVSGAITGEVVIQSPPASRFVINGNPVTLPYDPATRAFTIPFPNKGKLTLEVAS